MANRDTQERIDALALETQLQNSLTASLEARLQAGSAARQQADALALSLKSQIGAENKLKEILDTKQKLLENRLGLTEDQKDLLLEELEIAEKLVQTEKERRDLEAEIKEQMEDTNKTIIEMLGGSKEMADIFRTGGILAAGVKAFENSTQAISDAFSTTFGTAFEMYKTIGISAKEGAILAGEIGKARFSMAGLLYDGEDFANASKALVDQFGNVNMATDDMVLGVTELSQLTGDAASAVGLALSFQNAGVAVDEVDSILKDIGSKTGVTANKIAKEMADNQYLMVGATKQELKLIGQLNAELIKQGATRESIRGSAKSLMDIENTIQQANKIALMTGKMVNTTRLTEAAMQARTAEGAENKAKAQNELLKALKEELGVNGNISDQNDVTIEAMTSLSGLTEEQLLNMEQAGIAQKNNNKLTEEASAFWGALTAGAISFGAGIGSATLELIKMIAQAMIFNKVMTGNFGMRNLRFGGGGGPGPAPPTPPPTPPGPPGPPNPTGGINATSLLKGAAALLLMAAALFVFAKAMQEMKDVGIEELGMAIASIAIMAGGLVILGKLAPEVIIGAAALLIMASALLVFGYALQAIAAGVGMLAELPAILTPLAALAGGLALFGLALIPLQIGLIALAVGLLALKPVMPELLALVALGAGIALIANALGFGGGGSSETTTSNTKQSDPLLEEIKGLRADIKAQPINVVLNNKIVGEINRASRASNSYVNK